MKNKKPKTLNFILVLLLVTAACSAKRQPIVYQSDILKITPLTKNTYIHLSYLATDEWGKVPSNGLIYINHGEAVVFDTPASDSASAALISWIEDKKGAKIKAVVVNHFHDDCIRGISEFHKKNIPSYASKLTLDILKSSQADNLDIPQNGFEKKLDLIIGNKTVINTYPGEAHTRDNIVSYIPAEKVLFGGCMVKATGAKKGNLADANTKEWANTIRNVKNEFPDAEYVVPGHGEYGNKALLDYTIHLFNDKNK